MVAYLSNVSFIQWSKSHSRIWKPISHSIPVKEISPGPAQRFAKFEFEGFQARYQCKKCYEKFWIHFYCWKFYFSVLWSGFYTETLFRTNHYVNPEMRNNLFLSRFIEVQTVIITVILHPYMAMTVNSRDDWNVYRYLDSETWLSRKVAWLQKSTLIDGILTTRPRKTVRKLSEI